MPTKSEPLSTVRHYRGQFYGVAAALSFAAYILINRYVYSNYDVDTLNYTATFLVAGAGFAAISLAVSHAKTRLVNMRNGVFLVLVNGVLAGVGIGLLVFGQAYTSAINASIIATAAVLTTVFFSRVMLKEKFTRRQMIWVGVMFVGLYIAIVGTRLINFNKGDLIILSAICVLGFTNVFSKLLMKTRSSNFVADVRLVSGGIFFVGIGFIVNGSHFLVTSADWWPLLAGFVFWLTIKCMYAAIHLVGPNEAIVLGNSHPLLTPIVGVLVLGESYSLAKFLGSILVLTSVYFITKKSRSAFKQLAEPL